MTLSFSTHWPKTMPEESAGKETYFIDKIWEGLFRNDLPNAEDVQMKYIDLHKEKFGKSWDYIPLSEGRMEFPKIHTLREDPSGRWKAGNKIHPVIKNRTPQRFQFAPVIPCISTQEVEIIYSDEELCEHYGVEPVIKIDGRILNHYAGEYEKLAKQDGFENAYHFFQFFKSDWKGTLIHWTNFNY